MKFYLQPILSNRAVNKLLLQKLQITYSSPPNPQLSFAKHHLIHPNRTFNIQAFIPTVPLDLNLTLASTYSRALTPFPRAVSWCSRASATCSRAWFNSWRSRVYYSRALTPFHRAVGRCSRASVICSRAWFYVQMKHTARVHYSSSIQYMLAGKP